MGDPIFTIGEKKLQPGASRHPFASGCDWYDISAFSFVFFSNDEIVETKNKGKKLHCKQRDSLITFSSDKLNPQKALEKLKR